ncbi:MAG TPA: CAP domain-containing protein [Nostocaceae cyanobacterium]|nr:CAP domain-containing protein [Nostocaceae cyanobacterium]
MLRHTLSGLVAATVILAGSPGFSATIQKSPLQFTNVTDFDSQIAQSTIDTAAIENSVYQQINQYRVSQNLPPLARNTSIDNQARIHSQNMASGKVPFGHQGFQQRVTAIGIPYTSAAENVAYNQGYSDPATKAVQSWLQSSGHLANIKGNFNLTGVGVAVNSKGVVYFTQIFLKSR